jgi:hypothetical protein
VSFCVLWECNSTGDVGGMCVRSVAALFLHKQMSLHELNNPHTAVIGPIGIIVEKRLFVKLFEHQMSVLSLQSAGSMEQL